jgi:glyceraldehyde 3-phosphate dehydrogenase
MSKTGKGSQLRLSIVTRDKNDATTLEKRASLLRYDSIQIFKVPTADVKK